MDVVYIVGPDTHWHELRWSLRSVAACLPHDRVWLVGCRPPWVRGVEHVGVPQTGPKHANTWNNWRAIAHHPAMSPQVVFMNDDFFIMQPTTTDQLPRWHQGPIDPLIEAHRRTGRTDLLARKLETRELLHRLGHTEVISWELHIPLVINRAVLADAIAAFDAIARPGTGPCLCKRTWYAHHAGLTGAQHPDVKVSKLGDPFDPNAMLLSTTSETFTAGGVGQFIRDRFQRGIYEIRPLREGPMPDWRFRCTRYPGLLVPLPGAPAVRFHRGTATVRHQKQAEALIRLGGPFGIELVSGPADTAAADNAQDDTGPGGQTAPVERPDPPRRNASTETWRAYAVEHGLDPDTAAGMTRDQLITHVGR